MKPYSLSSILAAALCLALLASCSESFDNLKEASRFDVVWDSPSQDYTGTMPLGNGETGLNVWMEPDGCLRFYISRTDAWDDNARLLKVGQVTISFEPNIFKSGNYFSQRLSLREGRVLIAAGDPDDPVSIAVWVDANRSLVHVTAGSSQPLKMTARIESWRKEPFELPTFEVSDVLLDRTRPEQKHQPMIVEPDVILSGLDGRIGWYHHNAKSVGFDITREIQDLSGFPMEDPILHRTFGAVISGSDGVNLNDTTLQTGGGTSQTLSISVLTLHPSTPEEWLAAVEEQVRAAEPIPFGQRLKQHQAWWEQFWNRSWIYASDPTGEALDVTKAYVLQRYITACAGRGAYPIKFNGSIFTVPFPGAPGDADYRRWGPGYWWQNTRLPYLGLCTSGDYEVLKPLFRMYAGPVFELSKYRTRHYFGHPGAYYPECIYFWGAVFSESYGWQPASERVDKLQVSGWHKWEWVAGPELVWMMLDYYDHQQDELFLADTILPVAEEVMRFFDGFYETDTEGRLVMHPSQAVETWWDCINPMPEVAGLIAIADRILALPSGMLADDKREWFASFREKLPDLPHREVPEGLALAPAERFADKRNIENPELYAVFPFRLVTQARGNADAGILALRHAWDRGNFGWRQEEIFQAYLGLADEARENLVGRARNHDPNSRFPAFWGPNYDWVPDQDHGGVLVKAFQSMLLQTDGDQVHFMPAWPAGWDADFKLHIPGNKVVRGTIRNDKLTLLR
jgi:hypothetical protein